ncbi:MAG: hypothetical protein ACR2MG_15180 [Pyrinomonadaceae bacterium]
MTNKINFLTVFGILMLVSLACSFSTANLSEIKFGKDNSASSPGTKFKPKDEIFAVTSVNNAGGKNKVKFRLLFDDVEGAESGTVAYKAEKELEVEESREVYFNFSVPGGIVPGSYKTEVVLTGEDGKELDRKTATFTVSDGTSSKTSKTNKTTKPGKDSSDETAEEQTETQKEDSSKDK